MSCINRGVLPPFLIHCIACGLIRIPEQFNFSIIIIWFHRPVETNLAFINKTHLHKMFYKYVLYISVIVYVFYCIKFVRFKTLLVSPPVDREFLLVFELCCTFHCISISFLYLLWTAGSDSELFARKTIYFPVMPLMNTHFCTFPLEFSVPKIKLNLIIFYTTVPSL
jgi:hypothetical protein